MGDGLCSYNRHRPWSKSHDGIDVTGIQDQMQLSGNSFEAIF